MRAAPIAFALSLLCMAANAAPGKSLEVAPTTLELKTGEAGLLYVANHSAEPVTVQIDIYDWSQSGNADHLAPSSTAFVSPPLTTIALGERQIVRVLAQPAPSDHETAYRIRVSELPDIHAKADGVQVLLQFSIPAFVPGTRDERAIVWSVSPKGDTPELIARNDGDRTLKLAGLRISLPDSGSKDIDPEGVNYILPHSAHAWTIPVLAPPPRLHVEGVDERSGKPVTADIDVAR